MDSRAICINQVRLQEYAAGSREFSSYSLRVTATSPTFREFEKSPTIREFEKSPTFREFEKSPTFREFEKSEHIWGEI